MGADFDDVCVRCMVGLCEPRLLSSFSAFLSLSPLPTSFSLFVSLLSLSLSSPKYRIMTQFSWALRASREMVTIATAPVLFSRPTVAGA